MKSEKNSRGELLRNRIQRRFPSCGPRLVEFPSGAFMIDIDLQGETYVVEYVPRFGTYGLSKMSTATFGWEGYEEDFEVPDALMDRIEILCKSSE